MDCLKAARRGFRDSQVGMGSAGVSPFRETTPLPVLASDLLCLDGVTGTPRLARSPHRKPSWLSMKLWIGVTDKDWFRFLRSLSGVEEVNFWRPGGKGNSRP